MSDSEYEVESLTGRDNYWIWKIRMLDLFHLYGLHDIVVGTEPLPIIRGATSETIPSQGARVPAGPAITQAHVDSWADRNQRALGILRRHVEARPLIHIRNSEGAHQAWDTLQTMYEYTGPIAIGHLRRELYTAHMTESDDLVEFIGHMRMILHKLNGALSAGGHPETTQLEFIHVLLTSLPPSYGALVSTFAGKPEADDPNGEALSERLLGRLISEDQRRRLCYGAPHPQMRKSSTAGRRSGDKRPNRPSEGGQGGNRMACGHCGRIGHVQAQCYAPGGPKDRRGNNRGGNDYAV